MDTTGNVVFGGSQVSVTGFSWMDHEFGTSALSEDAVGWDWFAVTLDNGVVLMFAENPPPAPAQRRISSKARSVSPTDANFPSLPANSN